MRGRSSAKSRSPEQRETNLLLGLMILAVVLPTIGFLWFMTRAMQTERQVMKQQEASLQDYQTSQAQQAVDRYLKRLGRGNHPALKTPDLTDVQRFRRVTASGPAAALVCLGPNQEVRYPILASHLHDLELDEDDEKAQALRDQWIETAEINVEDAVDVLTLFEDNGVTGGKDYQGRLVYPFLQLATLQRLSRSTEAFDQVAQSMRSGIRSGWKRGPTAQWLFLAQEMRKLDIEAVLPEEEAHRLALDVLGHPLQLGQTSALEASPGMDRLWRLLTDDRRFLLLFREETIRSFLEEKANQTPEENAGVTYTVAAPDWRAVPSYAGGPAPDGSRRAFTLAVACLLLGLAGVIATLAIRRLLERNRLTQLRSDFLSTISHELKTPLTSTRMLVDTLVGGQIKDPEKAREYLEVIGRENARLSSLVENFLTYSRLESGRMPFEFTTLAPEDIVHQALDAVESKFEAAEVELRLELADDLPKVRADEATLTTALINLLDNAFKYSGDHKEIRLTVSEDHGQVRFSVSDNGIGLSASELQRVRERFYRVNQTGGTKAGSGLGLSIVNEILEAHHGELLIESLPQKGSVFTIVLPASGSRLSL